MVQLCMGNFTPYIGPCHWRIQGWLGGAMTPLATWASAQNALKVVIFRLKIEKLSGEGVFGARPWPPFANPGSATGPCHVIIQ